MIAILTIFGFALIGWVVGMMPERKESRRAQMRRELSQVSLERKTKIAIGRVELGQRCDLPRARELVKLLAFDGRTDEARAFGFDYLVRCGDDEIVDNWTHAPRPPR